MRFKPGDTTDSAHCTALKHEFLRCEDAFKDFETYGTLMILNAQAEATEAKGQPPTSAHEKRLIAYKTYNAYSRFILHLYEFMLGAVERETGSTGKLQGKRVDRYITSQAQRILTGRRRAIQNGTAPAWENSISYFPESVPAEFAGEFRKMRNKISVHVSHERSGISLSDFYEKYHKYVHMLFWNCLGHWGLRGQEFPDLREITRFSVLVKKGVSSEVAHP
jgi:hypothetical protein